MQSDCRQLGEKGWSILIVGQRTLACQVLQHRAIRETPRSPRSHCRRSSNISRGEQEDRRRVLEGLQGQQVGGGEENAYRPPLGEGSRPRLPPGPGPVSQSWEGTHRFSRIENGKAVELIGEGPSRGGHLSLEETGVCTQN